MSPVFICIAFVFILVAILLGLYIGINIRYYFLQREYRNEAEKRSKNILTDEERIEIAKRNADKEKEDRKWQKRKKKLARERKSDKRKQKREEKKAQREERKKKRDAEKKPPKQKRTYAKAAKPKQQNKEKEQKEDKPEKAYAVPKFRKSTLEKRMSDEGSESYTNEVCDMENDDYSGHVSSTRSSQDEKYDYNGHKPHK